MHVPLRTRPRARPFAASTLLLCAGACSGGLTASSSNGDDQVTTATPTPSCTRYGQPSSLNCHGSPTCDFYIELSDDGTARVGFLEEQEGRWSRDGSEVTITVNGEDQVFRWVDDGAALHTEGAELVRRGVCGEERPTGVSPPQSNGVSVAVQDSWFACESDDECAPVELGCCDYCNGGLAIGARGEHVATVHEYFGERDCSVITSTGISGPACTERGCSEVVAACSDHRCGTRVQEGSAFIANDLARAHVWRTTPPPP